MSEKLEDINMRELRASLSGYYIGFDGTGVDAVDDILRAIAAAGKAYHHTRDWQENLYGNDFSYEELIQEMANRCSRVLREVLSRNTKKQGEG